MKHLVMEKGWKRYFAVAFVAISMSLAVTACGNKGNGGSTVAVVNGVSASCVGCPASTTLVSSALGRSWDYNNNEQAQLSLNFYGDTATYTGSQASGSLYYQGSIVADGILRVRIAKTAPGCVVPAGDYTVTTLMPGQWSGQSFSQNQLQAIGPVTLQLELRRNSIWSGQTQTDWAGATFPFRIVSDVYVTSMSGGYCNAGGYPEYFFGF